jgi:hypothetical protein
MVPEILYRVCYGKESLEHFENGKLIVRPAILQGFCRKKARNVDYPGIIRKEGSSIRGMAVIGLTERHIKRLDIFEGDEYAREKVTVEVLNEDNDKVEKKTSTQVELETYVWIAGEDKLEPGEWDFDEFMKVKMDYWSGDAEYEGMYNLSVHKSKLI